MALITSHGLSVFEVPGRTSRLAIIFIQKVIVHTGLAFSSRSFTSFTRRSARDTIAAALEIARGTERNTNAFLFQHARLTLFANIFVRIALIASILIASLAFISVRIRTHSRGAGADTLFIVQKQTVRTCRALTQNVGTIRTVVGALFAYFHATFDHFQIAHGTLVLVAFLLFGFVIKSHLAAIALVRGQ